MFSRNCTYWEYLAQNTRATRAAWSRDNFLSADWLNCDGNDEEWTNGSGSSVIKSFGMRVANNWVSTGWNRDFQGMKVTKIMGKAEQQNRMTAPVHYSKNTDKLKRMLDYSLQIEFLIGQISELELSSSLIFPHSYECVAGITNHRLANSKSRVTGTRVCSRTLTLMTWPDWLKHSSCRKKIIISNQLFILKLNWNETHLQK